MNLSAGLDDLVITDSRENITFPALVMYPTDVPPVRVQLGPYSVDAARKAAIKTGKYPLVVISHGTGSSHLLFRTLAANLAQHGFIVCMPEHPFNNRNNNERADTIENLTDRPRHISEVVDAILADTRWRDHIHTTSIGAIGHSIGAYTVLAASGGIPHTKHQMQYDPDTKITRSEQIAVTADARIKALVLLAPATGWFKSDGALKGVDLPILILTGEKDPFTPSFHASIVVEGVASRAAVTHRVVPNAGHFSFLSPFPVSMRTPQFLPANDPQGFDREAFHTEMYAEIRAFLQSSLQS